MHSLPAGSSGASSPDMWLAYYCRGMNHLHWPRALLHSDDAARDWMEALYRARWLEERDTAGSVRAASLAVLAARKAEGRSLHPYFWAGFVAAGGWR